VLGGVRVPSALGPTGHSDGDVLLHALTDALLGAVAAPDIGTLFPDTDPKLQGADSARFLRRALALVRRAGTRVANADCVVVCDRPKLAPLAPAIRRNLARLLGIPAGRVGLQAKTTEGTRLAEPDRSIAVFAAVLVERK